MRNKKMCINITVDLDVDSPARIRAVINNIIEEANAQVFGVNSVTIGDETVFDSKVGLMGILRSPSIC